jgi:hypothetical protein
MSDGLSEALSGTYYQSKYMFRKQRITPDNITELEYNEIFIFGSNTAGRHGKGAAKTALKWNAKYGQGAGIQGKTYAIPTKDDNLKVLSLDEIKKYVDEFIYFAEKNGNLNFLVTEIGCGLSRYSPSDIAPLFNDVKYTLNIHLPNSFWKIIDK